MLWRRQPVARVVRVQRRAVRFVSLTLKAAEFKKNSGLPCFRTGGFRPQYTGRGDEVNLPLRHALDARGVAGPDLQKGPGRKPLVWLAALGGVVVLNPKNVPPIISAAVDYAQASLNTVQLAMVLAVICLIAAVVMLDRAFSAAF